MSGWGSIRVPKAQKREVHALPRTPCPGAGAWPLSQGLPLNMYQKGGTPQASGQCVPGARGDPCHRVFKEKPHARWGGGGCIRVAPEPQQGFNFADVSSSNMLQHQPKTILSSFQCSNPSRSPNSASPPIQSFQLARPPSPAHPTSRWRRPSRGWSGGAARKSHIVVPERGSHHVYFSPQNARLG